MTLNWCEPCNTYHWRDEKCMPLWAVWCPDYDQAQSDAKHVAGKTAAHAAERWAEKDDAGGDYDIIGGCPAVVMVAPTNEEGPVLQFRVSGESVPTYRAKQLPEQEKPT